jgi:chemotaxis methyl-accepting protein methylase
LPHRSGDPPADVRVVTPGTFFHEPDHFELLARRVLPELAREPGRAGVTVWSAGCASGEEAWSLAMVIAEAALPASWKVRVVATDRDPERLAWAANATYDDGRMSAVNPERRARHFTRDDEPGGDAWRVAPSLRARVELWTLDLGGPWPARDPSAAEPWDRFDVVVCHRAIAELDAPCAARLVYRLADALAPGGVLLLGPSRWLPTGIAGFELYGRAAFRKMR